MVGKHNCHANRRFVANNGSMLKYEDFDTKTIQSSVLKRGKLA